MALVKIPGDNQLISDLENIGHVDIRHLARRTMDSSPFTTVEEITFTSQFNKNYSIICKSLLPGLFKDEVIIHRAVSDLPINGPAFYHGTCDGPNDLCYILMENIKFNFLYNYLDYIYLKEVIQMLINYQNTYFSSKQLRSLPLKRHGFDWYSDKRHTNDCLAVVQNLVENKVILDENLVPVSMDEYGDFENNYYRLIGMMKDLVANLPKNCCNELVLVHGDFDSGNIIVFDNNEVAVIDWGMAHLDTPILDISHLFSSLQGLLPVDQYRALVNHYFRSTAYFWGSTPDRWNVIRVGQIMHHLYYLHHQTKCIKNGWVEPDYFSERIYRKFSYFKSLLSS
ncbi:MAG: phosphotransferase [Candidatus Odinarchaeota archaeon]